MPLFFVHNSNDAYQNKAEIDGVFARFQGHEAIFICQRWHVTLGKYISFESSIFFRGLKKC